MLGGRERLDACETLLLRARADLDAGREREAALQLRVGLEALLAELQRRARRPRPRGGHRHAEERRHEVGEAANEALRGDLDARHGAAVRELLEISERVLRRRRVLRGKALSLEPVRVGARSATTASSASDSAMWCASSSATPSTEGTPITVRPAATAAATPVGESSSATTSGPGSTPSRRQASR